MKGRDVSLSEAIVKARGALEERLLPGIRRHRVRALEEAEGDLPAVTETELVGADVFYRILSALQSGDLDAYVDPDGKRAAIPATFWRTGVLRSLSSPELLLFLSSDRTLEQWAVRTGAPVPARRDDVPHLLQKDLSNFLNLQRRELGIHEPGLQHNLMKDELIRLARSEAGERRWTREELQAHLERFLVDDVSLNRVRQVIKAGRKEEPRVAAMFVAGRPRKKPAADSEIG